MREFLRHLQGASRSEKTFRILRDGAQRPDRLRCALCGSNAFRLSRFDFFVVFYFSLEPDGDDDDDDGHCEDGDDGEPFERTEYVFLFHVFKIPQCRENARDFFIFIFLFFSLDTRLGTHPA